MSKICFWEILGPCCRDFPAIIAKTSSSEDIKGYAKCKDLTEI